MQIYTTVLLTLSYLPQMGDTTHRQPPLPEIKIFIIKHVPKTLVIVEYFHMNTIKIMTTSFEGNTTIINSKSWVG